MVVHCLQMGWREVLGSRWPEGISQSTAEQADRTDVQWNGNGQLWIFASGLKGMLRDTRSNSAVCASSSCGHQSSGVVLHWKLSSGLNPFLWGSAWAPLKILQRSPEGPNALLLSNVGFVWRSLSVLWKCNSLPPFQWKTTKGVCGGVKKWGKFNHIHADSHLWPMK